MSQIDVTLARMAELQQRFSSLAPKQPPGSTETGESFAGLFSQMLTTGSEDSPSTLSQVEQPGASTISAMIQQRSALHGVDPNLVKAIVQTESGFNPAAVSSAGAQGLMQLMPQTAKGLGVANSFDPEQNIDGGVRYLKGLIGKYQSLPKAVAAYNAGPGVVDRYNGIPPYAETKHYTEKVMNLYSQYNAGGKT